MVGRDSHGRFTSDRGSNAGEHGIDERMMEYIFGFIAGAGSVISQAIAPYVPDWSFYISIFSLILLLVLVISIVEEGAVFVLFYWFASWFLFTGKLISAGEFTFNIFFPGWVLFTILYSKLDTTDEKTYLIATGIIIVIGIIFFVAVGGLNPSPMPTTTSTVNMTSTTSSTSTSTSTSTTTTTIPPYTNCPTEPSTANIVPLTCNSPALTATNSIEFNISLPQNESTIYSIHNVNLACTVHIQSPSKTQFYPLEPSGVPDINRTSMGTVLYGGQTIHIYNWPCDGNSVNGSLEGYIWINFTPYSGSSSQINPWENYRAFDIYINEILSSSAYNQTINSTK